MSRIGQGEIVNDLERGVAWVGDRMRSFSRKWEYWAEIDYSDWWVWDLHLIERSIHIFSHFYFHYPWALPVDRLQTLLRYSGKPVTGLGARSVSTLTCLWVYPSVLEEAGYLKASNSCHSCEGVLNVTNMQCLPCSFENFIISTVLRQTSSLSPYGSSEPRKWNPTTSALHQLSNNILPIQSPFAFSLHAYNKSMDYNPRP